jgi:hypothetical protein
MSDEWHSQPEEWRVLIELEQLRRDHRAWAMLRRLVIVAPCCPRSPLIEVMDTDPPCVLVRQIAYGHVDPDAADRKVWSGARRGGQKGFVWLAAFERMAERGDKQFVWCHDRRWEIPATDVVTLQGRHVVPLPDK